VFIFTSAHCQLIKSGLNLTYLWPEVEWTPKHLKTEVDGTEIERGKFLFFYSFPFRIVLRLNLKLVPIGNGAPIHSTPIQCSIPPKKQKTRRTMSSRVGTIESVLTFAW